MHMGQPSTITSSLVRSLFFRAQGDARRPCISVPKKRDWGRVYYYYIKFGDTLSNVL